MSRAVDAVLDWAPWVATVVVVAGVLAYLVLSWEGRAADPGRVALPQVRCGPDVEATFTWTPVAGATRQWLDLSLVDDGFREGTYAALGPLDGAAGAASWSGLEPGQVYYWRVNALTADGWTPSPTNAFVPCGAAVVGDVSHSCLDRAYARVTFRWFAPSPSGLQAWVDVTAVEGGLESGAFFSIGPLSPGATSASRHGVYANVVHYWRVNTLFEDGWYASDEGSFIAEC